LPGLDFKAEVDTDLTVGFPYFLDSLSISAPFSKALTINIIERGLIGNNYFEEKNKENAKDSWIKLPTTPGGKLLDLLKPEENPIFRRHLRV